MASRTLASHARVILFLHNRYRTTGGEERVVEDLALARRASTSARRPSCSSATRRDARPRARAARGLLRGGLRPEEVAAAVRRTGARVVHAHNLHPALRLARAGGGARGGRARRAAPAQLPARLRGRHVLHAAARTARAATGRNTLPGRAPELPRHRPRGGRLRRRRSRCGSGGWSAQADAVVVPQRVRRASGCASWARRSTARASTSCRHVVREFAARSRGRGRRARARRRPAGAGEGRRRRDRRLRARAACRSSSPATGRGARAARARAGGDVRFAGPRRRDELAALRAGAALALVPVALGRDLRAGRRRGDGRRRARRRQPRSARCPSSSATTGSSRPATPPRWPPPRGALARGAAAAGLRRVRALAAPAEVAARLRAVYRL